MPLEQIKRFYAINIISESQHEECTPRLANLLKLLLWTQNELDKVPFSDYYIQTNVCYYEHNNNPLY